MIDSSVWPIASSSSTTARVWRTSRSRNSFSRVPFSSPRNSTAGSFVPQLLDRIEIRCFVCGIGPKDDSNHRTDHQANNDPVHGQNWSKFQKIGSGVAAENPKNYANSTA